MESKNWKWWLSASMVSMLAACSGGTGEDPLPKFNPDDPQPVPTVGQSEFVSADGANGEATQDNDDSANNQNAAPADAGAEADDTRTVEEGDIYQVMSSSNLILNLNSYRGLQIIDFADVDNPEIVGHVQVSGTPVEMYQVGDRVFALLNNWRGYWGSRDDIAVDTFEGGLVLAIDVSDPTNPKVTGQATIPGWVRKSRLTRGGDKEALFVVASEYDYNTGEEKTYVKSFKVSDTGTLAEKSLIDLGGYVTDIQASPELLMVARWDWNRSNQQSGSDLTLIDITDPDGTMVEGDTITVNGQIAKKTNMDHRGDILRVVSGNDWSNATNTNHVQTFNVADIDNVTPIDSETFGDGESLFGTLFMEDRAFFVTYQQVDPFHAFSVTADGQLEERSEFIISGWNDWFRPVQNNTRIVGIGYNDQNGNRALAVSLYDITDLDNPTPLIQRQTMDQNWGWSEATWDDRAFSVLEKGTAVQAPTGELETGLVLLPFNGWNDTRDTYESGVQIFTFSDTTLTARGVMPQDTQVRRSFMARESDNTTANLSEAEVSFFDTTDPDSPDELSRLELAPNYTDFLIFGDHGVRRHDNYAYYYWWSGRSSNFQPTDTLQVVSLAGDVDSAAPLAEIEVPTFAQLYKVGDLLVSVSSEHTGYSNNKPEVDTTIEVWDLSNPTAPQHMGELMTDKLPPQWGYYGGYYWGGDDVAVAGLSYYFWGGSNAVSTLENAMVFSEYTHEQRLEGEMKRSWQYPRNNRRWENCYDQTTYEPKECTFLDGGVNCSQLTRVDGTVEDEVCTGGFYTCRQDDTGNVDCDETTPDPSELESNSYTYEHYRYWTSTDFHVVDLSDADNPKLGSTVVGGKNNETAGVLAKGDDLYFTYKRPTVVSGDSRPFVKFYFQKLDYSNPSAPTRGAEINIPGELLEVDDDTIITRDFLWGENIVETSINKLRVAGDKAYLKGVNRFLDRQVESVKLDGDGNVLVTHRIAWLVNRQNNSRYDYENWDNTLSLSLLDMDSLNFDQLAEVEIDDWAHLQGAIPGKALFTVPGGMLVVNIADPAAPHAQAYFALRGWPHVMQTKGNDVYFPAGPFGLYTFDATQYNLQPAP